MLALLLAVQAATGPVPPPVSSFPVIINECLMVGPYIVFFAPGSSTLDAEARAIVEFAVDSAEQCNGPYYLTIEGHANVGEPRGVDRRRAAAARRLIARRARWARIAWTQGFGATRPRRGDTDPRTEPMNRRVQITLMPYDPRSPAAR